METEFNWWIAIAVFFTFFVIYYDYTLHYFFGAKIGEFRDLLYKALTFGISCGVAAYTKHSWYFVSIALGMLAAHMAAKFAAHMAAKYFPIKLSNNGN